MSDFEIDGIFSELVKKKLIDCERICAGKNSRVFRIRSSDGVDYVLKQYFQKTVEGRSRLQQEWEALSFMGDAGISNVPKPLYLDTDRDIAVYSFLTGSRVETRMIGDISSVLNFLSRLNHESKKRSALLLKPASEACFSPSKLVANIKKRLFKLMNTSSKSKFAGEMQMFLNEFFLPAFLEITQNAQSLLGQDVWLTDLANEYLTLSPSDFGFHNALRDSDGKLFFLDFEYFGWDDPAKIISDFILHPAMELTMNEKKQFISGMQELFRKDKNLSIRLKALFPLYRLKWSLILLNEFLKPNIKRRQFASSQKFEIDFVQLQQLEKSKLMLLNTETDKLVENCC